MIKNIIIAIQAVLLMQPIWITETTAQWIFANAALFGVVIVTLVKVEEWADKIRGRERDDGDNRATS